MKPFGIAMIKSTVQTKLEFEFWCKQFGQLYTTHIFFLSLNILISDLTTCSKFILKKKKIIQINCESIDNVHSRAIVLWLNKNYCIWIRLKRFTDENVEYSNVNMFDIFVLFCFFVHSQESISNKVQYDSKYCCTNWLCAYCICFCA